MTKDFVSLDDEEASIIGKVAREMGIKKSDVIKKLIRNKLNIEGGNEMDEATIAALLGGGNKQSPMESMMQMMMMGKMLESMNGSKKEDDISIKDIMMFKMMSSMMGGNDTDIEKLLPLIKGDKDNTPESIIKMMEKMLENNKDKVDSNVMAVVSPLVDTLREMQSRLDALSEAVVRSQTQPVRTRSLTTEEERTKKNDPLETLRQLREMSKELDALKGTVAPPNDPESAKLMLAAKQTETSSDLKKDVLAKQTELLKTTIDKTSDKLDKILDMISNTISAQQEAQIRSRVPPVQPYAQQPAYYPPQQPTQPVQPATNGQMDTEPQNIPEDMPEDVGFEIDPLKDMGIENEEEILEEVDAEMAGEEAEAGEPDEQ